MEALGSPSRVLEMHKESVLELSLESKACDMDGSI